MCRVYLGSDQRVPARGGAAWSETSYELVLAPLESDLTRQCHRRRLVFAHMFAICNRWKALWPL